MFLLPFDLIRSTLQSWISLKDLSRLDCAVCEKCHRRTFLSALVRLKRNIVFNVKLSIDLIFPWLVARKIIVPTLYVNKLSSHPDHLQFAKFGNSPTVLNLTTVIFMQPGIVRKRFFSHEWCAQLMNVCPNLQIITGVKISADVLLDHVHLKKFDGTQPEKFAQSRLVLPSNVTDLSLKDYISNSVLVQALTSCTKLTKLTVYNRDPGDPEDEDSDMEDIPPDFVLCSPAVYAMLPITLQELYLAPLNSTEGMEVMLQQCRALTSLVLNLTVDLPQNLFDMMFQLPHIEILFLDCVENHSVRELSVYIPCPTLSRLSLFGFVHLNEALKRSILASCTGLTTFCTSYDDDGFLP